MTLRTMLRLSGAALCLLSMSVSASDWIDIKDPNELTALYSNKTLKGNGWIGHYRADGKGILIPQNGKPVSRTWKVKGNDQVCATLESGATSCFRFQRHRKNRNEIVLTNVKDGMTFNATVTDGIPKF
jgi:hypothetical protein